MRAVKLCQATAAVEIRGGDSLSGRGRVDVWSYLWLQVSYGGPKPTNARRGSCCGREFQIAVLVATLVGVRVLCCC